MRILITNDDGISAPGLEVLHAIAQEVAGPEGEIWTVAPAFEQSGVGHKISYTHPTMIVKQSERRFAAEGAPADCVLAGLYDVLKDGKPDLILSGVNRGNNSAENVLYSGTIGAAMEGALQGVRSIALSQFYGPLNADLEQPFEAAAAYGAEVVRKLLKEGIWNDDADYRIFYNVNFPPIPAADVKGIRLGHQGYRRGVHFTLEAQTAPTGRRFLWVKGARQDVCSGEGSDNNLNLEGYIAVTPLRADLTAYDTLAALQENFA